MAQHDYVLDNANGAAFRADANAVLSAIRTTNSGSTEPSTPFAGQLWLDTSVGTNGKLKLRNQANNAWLDVAAQSGTVPVANGGGGGTTAVANIDAWHTKSSSIVAASTTNLSTATGLYVHITGNTTIAGFTSQTAGVIRIVTFDGTPTLTHNATSFILLQGDDMPMGAGDTAVFVSEGSGNWKMLTYNRVAAPTWETVVPWTAVAGSVGAIDFVLTQGIYTRFRITWEGLRGNGNTLYGRVFVGGVLQSSISNYAWASTYRTYSSPNSPGDYGFGSADANQGQTLLSSTALALSTCTVVGNTTGAGAYGHVEFNPFDTTMTRCFRGSSVDMANIGIPYLTEFCGVYGAVSAIDRFRIALAGGTGIFANTGRYRMDGMR